jgi:hypothetical protein
MELINNVNKSVQVTKPSKILTQFLYQAKLQIKYMRVATMWASRFDKSKANSNDQNNYGST